MDAHSLVTRCVGYVSPSRTAQNASRVRYANIVRSATRVDGALITPTVCVGGMTSCSTLPDGISRGVACRI